MTRLKKAAESVSVRRNRSGGWVVIRRLRVNDPKLHAVISRLPEQERVNFIRQVLRFGAIIAESEGEVERLGEIEGHAVILQIKPKDQVPINLYR